jgi:lysosomal acid lipase/cholesteryl ester hydrolase
MDAESTPFICGQSSSNDFLSAPPPPFIQSAWTGSPYGRELSLRNKISLFFGQALSFIVSSLCLFLVVGWALLASIPALIRGFREEREVFEWDNPAKYRSEKNTHDVTYYAREAGFDIVNEEVETEDGFLLRSIPSHCYNGAELLI